MHRIAALLAGQMLGITDQPDKLRVVLSYTVHQGYSACYLQKHVHRDDEDPFNSVQNLSRRLHAACTRTCLLIVQRWMSFFRRRTAGTQMVCCDLFFNSRCSYYYYLVEQPPVPLSANAAVVECSYCRNGQGWYHIDGPEMKTKAADLIKQEKYIFLPSNVSFILCYTTTFDVLTMVML